MSVSIIMPTYNCAPYIADAVKSVIAQTYPCWELYIIDDCSSDNTADIVKDFVSKYSNIHYECLEQNGGPAAARNRGLESAKGEYIAFLDSDDLWLPSKLEKQIAFMEENHCDFCCSAYDIMDESGNPIGETSIPPKQISYWDCIRRSNPIGNLTAVYRRSAFHNVTVPNIRKRNDFALWLRLLRQTDYCYGLSDSLALYRTGRNTSISGKKWDQLGYHWQLYHDIEGLNLFYSIYGVFCWLFVKGKKHMRRAIHQRGEKE